MHRESTLAAAFSELDTFRTRISQQRATSAFVASGQREDAVAGARNPTAFITRVQASCMSAPSPSLSSKLNGCSRFLQFSSITSSTMRARSCTTESRTGDMTLSSSRWPVAESSDPSDTTDSESESMTARLAGIRTRLAVWGYGTAARARPQFVGRASRVLGTPPVVDKRYTRIWDA